MANSMKWLFLLLSLAGPTLHGEGGERVVLFLGDSLTAGYGLDPADAFPALIEKKLKAAKLPFHAVNAGLSGETTAGGRRRIQWLMRRNFDILVLSLGANDGLRGFDPESTRENLQAIMDAACGKFPHLKIILSGMKVPPNMGPAYATAFKRIFPQLAKRNNAVLIPFLLEGVAAHPELNQADGIHPNEEGHKIIAETVWKYLQPLLEDEPGPAGNP